MKRLRFLLTALFCCVCMMGMSAYADTYHGDGYTLEYVIEEDAAAITGCSGSSAIVIPDTISGYKVVSIENDAFKSCVLTSVTIPDSVTTIGDRAFWGCSVLTTVTIPDGVTSIGTSAFGYCGALTSITIPGSVTDLSTSLFESCSSLTSVTISDGVTAIGVYAFYSCTNLTSVTIPDSVTTIKYCAFCGCASLTSLSISNSVVSLDENAFGTVYNGDDNAYHSVPGFTAYVHTGSKSEEYCKENSINYVSSAHSWDSGTITTEATCTSEGIKTFTCSICRATKTETIPAAGHTAVTDPAVAATATEPGKTEGSHCSVCAAVITAQEVIPAKGADTENQTGSTTLPDSNPVSQDTSGLIGLSASELNVKLTSQKSDEMEGTVYQILQLRAKKIRTTSLTIQWNKVSGATAYIVYGARCGRSFRKLQTVTTNRFTQKNLKKGAYYKYFVVAVNGNTVTAASKTIHLATSGGKAGNDKTVTLNKKSVRLKVGKTLKLKASTKPYSPNLKVRKHRAVCFESSNPAIAAVTSRGQIKAIAKGTCYVYAYAQDGVSAKIKVTVK